MQNEAHKKTLQLRLTEVVFIGMVLVVRICCSAAPSQVVDAGSSPVNRSGISQQIMFSLSGLSAAPMVSIGGVDFTSGSLQCNSGITSCWAGVTFLPRSAGIKQDVLYLKDGNGNLLASAFLHGIGTGPSLRAFPASISTLAGNRNLGYIDGAALSASFRGPQGLAVDLHSNVYIADSVNQVVRKYTLATGLVSTVAGNGASGYSGDGGAATSAALNTPTGIALDAGGNLLIADQGNGLIRRVDAASGIITTVAGGGSRTAEGVAATSASLFGPNSVAVDVEGNIYISDSFHNLLRKVNAATGLITTLAGGGSATGTDSIGDGALATTAQLDNPTGLSLDPWGNVYFADTGHRLIRRVDSNTGIIIAVVGTGDGGSAGDGGLATSATLSSPTGVCLDAGQNLYIADAGTNRVRFVNSSSGIISTIAGNGSAGFAGDGGNSAAAALNSPNDVVVASSGALIISDYSNNILRTVIFRPPPLTFPSINVTLTSGAVPVTLANYGNDSLIFSGLAISAPFRKSASVGTDCSVLTELTAGAGCDVAIEFSPTVLGIALGTVAVSSNDAAQLTISLSGTGLAGYPVVHLSAASLNFASRNVTTTSVGQIITLSNTGTASLSGLTLVLGGQNVADFSLATTCQSALAVSSSCNVTTTFTPLLAGSRTASINVFDSASGSPQVVSLSGAGVGGTIASFNVTSLLFGPVPIGTESISQTATLTNTGTTALGIRSIVLSGSNTADFLIESSSCGSVLAASASCSVTLIFVPTAGGIRTAQLLVADTAGNSPQSVSLSGGSSLACKVSLSATAQTYLSTGASGTLAVTDASACNWSASSGASWIALNGNTSGSASRNLSYIVSANITAQPRTGTITVGGATETITQSGLGLRFIPVTPCRLLDTRLPPGPLGGPGISALTSRDFTIPGVCGVPTAAQAYAINVTVVPAGSLHYVTIYPAGNTQPLVSTLNSPTGLVKANAAIIPAGVNGAITAFATDATDLIIDINGYFVLSSDTSALSFYPLPPCRVADSRQTNGALGGPFLLGQKIRDFSLQSGNCGLPSTAQAFSLNFTVVPRTGRLNYLSVWPTGRPQPLVSTLNDPQGQVIANAAIVRAGDDGSISAFVTQDAELIIDVDGYFAPPQESSGLSLYNLTPCRAFDSRLNGGAPVNGVTVVNPSSCPIPLSQVQAYVFNATIVPTSTFHYLTLWPDGDSQPVVSTLNGGGVVLNLAIVPSVDGMIDAFTTDSTALILDVFGYFGP